MTTVDILPMALCAKFLDLSYSRLHRRVQAGESSISGWRFFKLGGTWIGVPPYETATPREVTREQVAARLVQHAQESVNS